ncbi:MAG TPA: DUF2802 domain-containing protein [Burkholderiales bacterium]|nr:DUF2802 domain-containing protein [Burkholderiales bacterium]
MQINDWIWIISAIVGTWIVVIVVVLYVYRMASKAKSFDPEFLLREDLIVLRQELDTLRKIVESQSSDSRQITDVAYSVAIDLARQGRSAQSLASECGISRAEAELIIALHSRG